MSPAECSATKVSSPHPISSPQQAVTTHECPTTRATLQPIIMVGLLHGGNDSPYVTNISLITNHPAIRLTSQSRWRLGHGLRHLPIVAFHRQYLHRINRGGLRVSGCQLRRPRWGASTHSCARVAVPAAATFQHRTRRLACYTNDVEGEVAGCR